MRPKRKIVSVAPISTLERDVAAVATMSAQRNADRASELVVRYTFKDGSTWVLPVAVVLEHFARQRTELKRMKVETKRANGSKGGRPRALGAPTKAEIVLRYGDRWLSRWNDGSSAARAWLVKRLAGEHEKDDRQARRWLDRALGPAPKKRSRK